MELPPTYYEYRVIAMNEQQQPSAQNELSERVRKAFDAVRRRDLQDVSELHLAGKALIPLLAPYLRDQDEDVRREAVSLLSVIAGPDALPEMVRALEDPSPEICERAAIALYANYEPSDLTENKSLGPALARIISSESVSAAAFLLSAYFPTEEVQAALQLAMKRRPVVEVKLFAYSTPVSVLLPIQVAMAHHGSGEAQAALVKATENASVADVEFLIASIREADSSYILRALAKFLDDPRPATTILHSAPNIRLRICDLAANAFVKRLDMNVSFKLSELKQYDLGQIDEVRRLVDQSVPDRPVPERVKSN